MTRSPGRPAVGPRIAVRLDPKLLALIDAEAERSEQSRASTIRTLLDRAVSATGATSDTGVDVAQIRRALKLTPAERIRTVARTEQGLSRIRGRAAS